jgi:hypothetical protein
MAIDPRVGSSYRDEPTASPRAAEAIDVSSGDHALTVIPTCIRVGDEGTLYASLADEPTTFHTYTNVSNGELLIGQFHTIRSDSTVTNAVAMRP